MLFSLVYEIGDAPKCTDTRGFLDFETAKAYAKESLANTVKASCDQSGSLRLGQIVGEDQTDDVEWLGAYHVERQGEPTWSEMGNIPARPVP